HPPSPATCCAAPGRGLARLVCGNGRTRRYEAEPSEGPRTLWRITMMTTSTKETVQNVAVAFLASDVNRFSINALTGAIEQDPDLQVKLRFPHPRSASLCKAEIEQLIQETGPSGTVVVAFSFMSSALVTTAQLL